MTLTIPGEDNAHPGELIAAAKWAGAKVVRVEIDGGAIAILLDDAYLEKLAPGQPPAPDLPSDGKPKLHW
jgi:hypothetical protein